MDNLKYIFVRDNYISSLDQETKLNKDKLYKHLLESDIKNYIDKFKVQNNFNSLIYDIHNIKSIINNKYIFAQIVSARNVAISKEETKQKEYDNLDEIEDEDNIIDDNKYLQGDNEQVKKAERINYKLGFTSTGDDLFYGFEYSQFSKAIHDKLSSLNVSHCLKVILGPNIEVRRGIFFLNNNNFNILDLN